MIYERVKHSRLPVRQTLACLVDKGYQGIKKLHANSQVPQKKPRKGKLSDEDKNKNRELARKRVIVEQVNRKLKIFNILADRYRNRRKRFGLRLNLIPGIYNYELMVDSTQKINNYY